MQNQLNLTSQGWAQARLSVTGIEKKSKSNQTDLKAVQISCLKVGKGHTVQEEEAER